VQQRDSFLQYRSHQYTGAPADLVWLRDIRPRYRRDRDTATKICDPGRLGHPEQRIDGSVPDSPWSIHGYPIGLVGWALDVLGVLLIIVGIVLHIVRGVTASAHGRDPFCNPAAIRKCAVAHDRSRSCEMPFNIGSQHAAIVNNIAGDQTVHCESNAGT
jgi:hypothetical protein